MDKNTQRLREIMSDNKLSNKDVGALLGRSEQTVRIWSCINGGRVIPNTALKLLEFIIAVPV